MLLGLITNFNIMILKVIKLTKYEIIEWFWRSLTRKEKNVILVYLEQMDELVKIRMSYQNF